MFSELNMLIRPQERTQNHAPPRRTKSTNEIFCALRAFLWSSSSLQIKNASCSFLGILLRERDCSESRGKNQEAEFGDFAKLTGGKRGVLIDKIREGLAIPSGTSFNRECTRINTNFVSVRRSVFKAAGARAVVRRPDSSRNTQLA